MRETKRTYGAFAGRSEVCGSLGVSTVQKESLAEVSISLLTLFLHRTRSKSAE